MLRQVSRTRAAVRAAGQSRRAFSAPAKTPATPKTAPPTKPAPNSINSSKPVGSTPSASRAAAEDSSTGSLLPKLLLLGLLSTPAATALYVNQNPQWNPEPLKDNAQWIQFRGLVLGPEKVAKAPVSRSPEDFSAAISKGQHEVKKEEQKAKKEVKKAEKKEKKVEKKAEKKLEKAEKKVDKLKKEVKTKTVAKKVEDKVHKVEKGVKQEGKAVAAAAATAATAVEKKVDAATAKAREEIAKLAGEASPEHLSRQMDKQIQATTVCARSRCAWCELSWVSDGVVCSRMTCSAR